MSIRPFTRECDTCFETKGHQEAYARLNLALREPDARRSHRRGGQR